MSEDNDITEDPERSFNYFACACDDETRAEAEAFLVEAKKVLDADDSNLLSRVVYGLEWDIGEPAYITMMACDQWAAIAAETHNKHDDGEPLYRSYVQCDLLEHGLAATFMAFRDRFSDM